MNTTLIYDHCKNHPQVCCGCAHVCKCMPVQYSCCIHQVPLSRNQWIDVRLLEAATNAAVRASTIDDVAHLARTRIYLYRGTKDSIYLPGSVQAVGDYFGLFIHNSSQIAFEHTIPSLHALPTLDFGSPCGENGSPPGMCDLNIEARKGALFRTHTWTVVFVYTLYFFLFKKNGECSLLQYHLRFALLLSYMFVYQRVFLPFSLISYRAMRI